MRVGRNALAIILLAAFALGAVVAVRLPPLAAHDELYHWLRVEQISEGHLFPERVGEEWGGAISAAAFHFDLWLFERYLQRQPLKLVEVWGHARELASRPSDSVVVAFSNYATFSPLPYLPQAAGVFLARSVGANLLVQILVGRLFNLAAYIAMLGIIVRTVPGGQAIFLALALVPTAVYLAASLSADPLNFIIPAALFALCLRYRDPSEEVISSSGWMRVAALTAAVGLLKIVWVMFAAAPVLIPWQRFGSKRRKMVFLIAAIGCSVLLWVAWNATYPYDIARFWNIDFTPAGFAFVVRQPVHVAGILGETVRNFWFPWWLEVYEKIGGVTGFGQRAPFWVGSLSLPVIMVLAISDGERRDLAAATFLMLYAAAFAVALMLAFLVAFTPSNATMVTWIEGRYFLIFCVLVGWGLSRLGWSGPRLAKLCAALLAATLIMNACFLIYAVRFYDDLWIF